MTTKEVDNGPADESQPAWVKAYELAKAGELTAALKLERNSLVNVQRASSGFTLLHQAAWHGASVAAEKLILLGARRDATDKEGKTAAAVATPPLPPLFPFLSRASTTTGAEVCGPCQLWRRARATGLCGNHV